MQAPTDQQVWREGGMRAILKERDDYVNRLLSTRPPKHMLWELVGSFFIYVFFAACS